MPENIKNIRFPEEIDKFEIEFDGYCDVCKVTTRDQKQEISRKGNLYYKCPCGEEYLRPYRLSIHAGESERTSAVRRIINLTNHLQ
jgi:hypothetical protein